jgi:two-component system sensor histidine kinase YesM
MYHLLIVEDEEIIRRALPLIIDWRAIGFEVVGTTGSAAEALQIIDEQSVDVVLTDIKMPIVSGLELAGELKTRFPEIKTVLLSAYRDFNYALKGIEYGVYGYLLKTDSKTEIRNYFVKLKDDLDRERIASSTVRLDDRNIGNEQPQVDSVPPAAAGAIVTKALAYLQANYAKDVHLDDVAEYVRVHPVYLCRLFNHELGTTFKEKLTCIRIEKAKELLRDPGARVYEISLAVGYLKPRYFSDLFKKVTGMTPLEYRETIR